jgi:hypothetical protein
MSETTEQAGAGPTEDPAPQPAPAPASTPADTTTEADARAEDTDAARSARDERRWATLSAKLAAGDAERDRLAQQLEDMRRRAPPEPPDIQLTPEMQAIVDRRVAEERARERVAVRVEDFHSAGRAAYPDWAARCASLMSMGADPQIAELLVETPGGARVAAALADDPAELRKIAETRTAAGRALALGRFAASVGAEQDEPLPTLRNVSRAPPPPRTVGNGRVQPTVDPTRMTTDQLVDMYQREAMARRGL